MVVNYEWRGDFDTVEINELQTEAFETRVLGEAGWNWRELVHKHSLG